MAEQHGGEPEHKPAEGAASEKRRTALEFVREQFSLPGIEAWSNSTRAVLINALFLLTVVVVFPVLIAQFRRGEVVIEPIAVPQALIDQGLTADVAASRLWDGMKDVKDKANTAKTSIDAIPSAQQVQFSFPDSGISIESLVFHVRRMFNAYETRIAGEITCTDSSCARSGMQLRLRVIRNDIDIINLPPLGNGMERRYFEDAARSVLGLLDPFVAMAALSHDQPDAAVAEGFRRIRAGHPDSGWFYDQIGRIRMEQGRLPDAIDAFRNAIDLDKGFFQAHAGLGDALLRHGDLDEADKELTFARNRNPKDPRTLEASSRLARARGDADGAVKLLLAAAKEQPDNPDYLYHAGLIELARQRTEAGEALMRQTLDIAPGYVLAIAALAASDLEKKDYRSAEQYFRNAANLAPEDAKAQAAYANLLALEHKWEEAGARYARALELDPTNTAYKVQAAKCLQALGRDGEALARMSDASKQDPENPDVFMTMADSLRTLGRKEEALGAYRKVLDLTGTDPITRTMAQAWIKNLSG